MDEPKEYMALLKILSLATSIIVEVNGKKVAMDPKMFVQVHTWVDRLQS